MAKLKLLQPHEGHQAGEVIDVPGGIASVLALRRIGVLLGPRELEILDPVPVNVAPSTPPVAAAKPRAAAKPKAKRK